MLDPLSSATAYRLPWNQSATDYSANAEQQLTVHEVLGAYWGQTGDRVWVVKAHDCSRWEVLAGRSGPRWFELTANLVPPTNNVGAEDSEGNSYTLYLKSSDAGDSNRPLGAGRAGISGHAGTQCWAIYSVEHERWEIMAGQFLSVLHGVTDGQIVQGNTGTVSIYWPALDAGTIADSGLNVTAMNWQFPDIPSGARVTVFYDTVAQIWMICGCAPDAGKQNQDIVKDITVDDGHVTAHVEGTIHVPWWSATV